MKQRLSPVLASLANVFRIPTRQISRVSRSASIILNRTCNETAGRSSPPLLNASVGIGGARLFSSGSALLAEKGGKGGKKNMRQRPDRRIRMIRYFLSHPLTPRPLRFSRNRYLRHWTIHRAWQLFKSKQRAAREVELERQYTSMRRACEELRTGLGDGGKLFRRSMIKKGVFTKGPPIEYGRLQTETPSRDGWNYDWKRSG